MARVQGPSFMPPHQGDAVKLKYFHSLRLFSNSLPPPSRPTSLTACPSESSQENSPEATLSPLRSLRSPSHSFTAPIPIPKRDTNGWNSCSDAEDSDSESEDEDENFVPPHCLVSRSFHSLHILKRNRGNHFI
eukprot:GILI01030512.1.p1 GENE.GILI01030512.1~~GILI01030512.1.p1  ORF type:complete len:133 (+),score=3.94 GILI01030512.1:226-624(+)